jgi:hypothetical protein
MCGASRNLKEKDIMKLCKLGALATACGLFALFAIGNAYPDNGYYLFDLAMWNRIDTGHANDARRGVNGILKVSGAPLVEKDALEDAQREESGRTGSESVAGRDVLDDALRENPRVISAPPDAARN